MSIAVVGFDIGYQSSYISVAKGGGIETIANEFSDRCTPVCVSFLPTNRCIGTSAKNQAITNLLNTTSGCFTRLIGFSFDNPTAQAEMQRHSGNKFIKLAHNGRIGLVVKYMEQEEIFSMEQLYAMQLTKLKVIAEGHLGTKVVDIVLNVPLFFTDLQRRLVLDACEMAGCNCLRLLHDTTATGIAYGLSNKELPPIDQPPRVIIFIDLGAYALQTVAIAFTAGKMKVLATNYTFIGGKLFDERLEKHFEAEFGNKYKLDVAGSAKARVRLLQEVEKLKKLMNANSKALPLNIECFMQDTDVRSSMCRSDMESLCDDFYGTISACLQGLLQNAKLEISDIYDVELVGGAGRMSKVKEVIAAFFGYSPKTHLNADEAVARGCSLQCAILSPAFRVKDFAIEDALGYSVSVAYEEAVKEGGLQTLEMFPQWHTFPSSRQVTLNNRQEGDFWVRAFYTQSGHEIGVYTVKNVILPQNNNDNSNENGASVKIKVRINMHGIFCLSQAQLLEKVEKEVEKEVVVEKNDNSNKEGEKTTSGEGENSNNKIEQDEKQEEEKKVEKTVKWVTKATDLPITASIHETSSREEVMGMTERENALIAQDKLEHDRAVAKNAVEEFAYDMQDKLSGVFSEFVSEDKKESIKRALEAAVDWLYDEGEDLPKNMYVTRLEELKKPLEGVIYRAKEAEGRRMEEEALGKVFVGIERELGVVEGGEERYNHLDASKVTQLGSLLGEKRQWFTAAMAAQNALPPDQNPSLTVEQLKKVRGELEMAAKSLFSTPKPKIEPPPVLNNDEKKEEEVNVNSTDKKEEKTEKKEAFTQDMDID